MGTEFPRYQGLLGTDTEYARSVECRQRTGGTDGHYVLVPSGSISCLLDHGWEYTDFPPEPNKVDGTLLHFIERAYGYVPQANGYYPAYIFSDRYARIEITNLSYELREVVKGITVPWIREDLQQTCIAIAEESDSVTHYCE